MSSVPPGVKAAFEESSSYFPTALQQFQFFDKYSRYDYHRKRRETYPETVDRAVDYLHHLAGSALEASVYQDIYNGMLRMDVMPSMRLLAMAGPAAKRSNVTIYNCSYMPVEDTQAFSEALIISMSGCGVGYSVERRYVDQLPPVAPQRRLPRRALTVPDTTEGWAATLREAIEAWVEGYDVAVDFSEVRPAGAPLATKGGHASGPEPLRFMLDQVRRIILSRQGGKLRPIDAHDIMCLVGGAAVSGGMRRTAMISLFDAADEDMLQSKSGDLSATPWRWNANNSVVWNNAPNRGQFDAFFDEMAASGRGEPGIFSRAAAKSLAPHRRSTAHEFGTNPCGEIILRPYQFCNLSAAVARTSDTPATLAAKVRLATIIGTIQSLATHFPGLRSAWRENAIEERLLGVDITGQMDCPAVQDATVLADMKGVAITTNRLIADRLGINPSASITCVKPSGNSSQLLNCSSGLHARWAPYYVRNVRVSVNSPLYRVLQDSSVPMDPENGQAAPTATTYVVHFPVKSPDGATFNHQRTAVEQCEYWLLNKVNYTEHNPSCTITYKPAELPALREWVWEHRAQIGGLSFLPEFDAKYDQMPYETVTKQRYTRLAKAFPEIDFSRVWLYEDHDMTDAAQEVACVGGSCELEMITGAEGNG